MAASLTGVCVVPTCYTICLATAHMVCCMLAAMLLHCNQQHRNCAESTVIVLPVITDDSEPCCLQPAKQPGSLSSMVTGSNLPAVRQQCY